MGKNRKRTWSQRQADEQEGHQAHRAKALDFSENLPNGVQHYRKLEEVPWDIQLYWRQRFNIFSRYDQGIWLTDDLWFGVSQENVARKIAAHALSAVPSERKVVIDVMAGAGGNTIAFAQQSNWTRVYGIEKTDKNLLCAKRNAKIYGVHDKITWFEGDCFTVLGMHGLKELAGQYGVIFCSPPWGGPGYKSDHIFDLDGMEPYTVKRLYTELRKFSEYIVLYLPRSSDLRQIADLVDDGQKAQVIHYCARGASKALCAYLGPFGKITL